MREFGRVSTRYWTSPTIKPLSSEAKLLGAYLLSSDHMNMLGAGRLPLAYACEDLSPMGFETVAEGFRNLCANGFIIRDPESGWTFICNYLKHNPMQNPNQGKAAAKLLEQIPLTSIIYPHLIAAIAANATHFPQGLVNRFETLSKGSSNLTYPSPSTENVSLFLDHTDVARAVMLDLRIAGQEVMTNLLTVCKAELATGSDADELRTAMVAAWVAYEEAKPRLDFACGCARFFGDAVWRNPEGWPWKPGFAPTVKIGASNGYIVGNPYDAPEYQTAPDEVHP